LAPATNVIGFPFAPSFAVIDAATVVVMSPDARIASASLAETLPAIVILPALL
jgi:hypothetical protein